MSDQIKSTPVRVWAQAAGFTAVNPIVRKNTNGYPFLTFVKPDGKGGSTGENVYFSKKSAAVAIGHEEIDAEMRGDLLVVETLNEKGEPRLKLAFKGESDYEAI